MPPTPARHEFDDAILVHLDELYGAAVRLTRSGSEAEDLVQESVMRAWAFWDRFEPGTNARAWMHRILLNTFINGYRKRKREREIMGAVHVETELSPRPATADARGREEGLGDEVERALSEIPAEFRAAIVLVDLADHSYKDAARVLDCPIGTVMSRLHRGRRLLQDKLRTYATRQGYLAKAA
jgi:RNA polymerase sigma-70 factor (ECF subfamily)